MTDIQIRCFLEAAKHKSFSKAASLLFISQPTVSRNIGDLEREWNVKLFVRNGGNVSLTEAGMKMAAFFEEETGRYSDMLQGVRKEAGEGEVCIALLNGQMINSVIREAVLKMKQKYPDIRIGMQRFDYDEILDRLILKKVDLAELPRNAISFSGMQSRCHCRYETYLVTPDSSPYAYKKESEIKYFLKETLIMVEKKNRDPDGFVNLWTEKCRQYGITPSVRWARDIKQLEMLIELGEGVAICNINHMMTNSPHTRFVRLKELQPMPFDLIWNGENKNPAMEKFLSCVDYRPDEIL